MQQVLNTRGLHLTKLSATDNKILSGINATDCQFTDPSDKLRTALGIGWRTDDYVLLIKVDVKAANSKSDMLSSLNQNLLMQALNYTVLRTPVNMLMDPVSISDVPASRDIYTQLWWPAKYACVF